VGNDLVHAGSHARPQAVDRGMPSQGAPNGVAMNDGSLLVPNKVPRTNHGIPPPSPIANRLCYVYSDRPNKNTNTMIIKMIIVLDVIKIV